MEGSAVNSIGLALGTPNSYFNLFRLLLAALHFNANWDRHMARTSHGEARYAVRYPRVRKGGWVVRPIKENPSYGECFQPQNVIFVSYHCM